MNDILFLNASALAFFTVFSDGSIETVIYQVIWGHGILVLKRNQYIGTL